MQKRNSKPVKPAPPVRRQWLESTNRRLQIAAGAFSASSVDDRPSTLTVLADTLIPPRTSTETLLLRGLLIEFACRWSAVAHSPLSEPSPSTCVCAPEQVWQQFGSVDRADPLLAFRRWIRLFLSEFPRRHPPSPAARAAEILRREFDESVTVPALARRLGVNLKGLTRQFRQEFGISIPEYRSAARMAEAIRQLSTTKVDAVTAGVGYKSKTNFYRAFRALTGLTPTAFQRLSIDARTTIADGACSRLLTARRLDG